jgi:hypothetical protein
MTRSSGTAFKTATASAHARLSERRSPALARRGIGRGVVELIVQQERQNLRVWVACVTHAASQDDMLRDEIIETALGALPRLFANGLATEGGELLRHMAPYLDAEQARRALALATPMRSIAPRVRTLAALAQTLPHDERILISERARQAALPDLTEAHAVEYAWRGDGEHES